ncbi:DUF4419 domain-containing protein [Sorangium sp. So ce1153]|uniref:DUF4419 domain-containing protein n=1 Tax=Sorangium sp. So ce1153 TaxID=3133333 RepID=UPI003F635204
MAITFEVSPVQRAHRRLADVSDEKGENARPVFLLGRPVEAFGSNPPRCLRARQHGLLAAVGTAFRQHYPLALTPDAVWLAIAQGFAAHVKANAERLRGKFVRHEGQAELRVRRDDFVKGSPENPWPEVFSSFSEQVAAHIGRQRDLVVCDFSTTGPCERAASEIVLLDAMRSYFKYSFETACGIPSITLEGTVEDYRRIRRRVQALSEYDLSWWTEALLPIVDRFIDAFEGRIDVAFWRSLFKLHDESGGPFITGWINAFFPYLDIYGDLARNRAIHKDLAFMHLKAGEREGGREKGFDPAPVGHSTGDEGFDDLNEHFDYLDRNSMNEGHAPSGLSAVSFTWDYLLQQLPMEFLGGFVGIAQDEDTLALRPAIGWAVREAWDFSGAGETSGHVESTWTESEYVEFGGFTDACFIAGRASLAPMLPNQSVYDIRQMLRLVRRQTGIALACFALEEQVSASLPGGSERFPERLFVGIRLASRYPYDATIALSSFAEAYEQLERVPASIWRDLSALSPGGLSEKNEATLFSFRCKPPHSAQVLLVFGEKIVWRPSRPLAVDEAEHVYPGARHERCAIRGVKVAELQPSGRTSTVVDMSAAAEAERRAMVEAIGVPAEAATYHVVVRPIR